MVALIAGTIFSDLDFDGVQDSQEAGLKNFEIQLLDSSGNIEATTTTDTAGVYEFSNLDSDSYIVRQVIQPGFVQTSPNFATEIVNIQPGITDDFQSPVDIINIAPPIAFDEILKTSYDGEGATEIENKGSNFEVIYEEGNNNFVNLKGEEFEIINIHFHAESEHAVDGELSELEMHLVHGNETGGLTVLGVLIEEGEFNPTLAPIFNTVDSELEDKGELPDTVEFTEEIEIAELLPDNSGWFYNGSLTTPPFSEDVNWFVFEESIEISSEQMDVFQDFLESVDLESNNRDLQPLNGRQFNELNYQIQVTDHESINDLDFGNTPVNEIVGGRGKDELFGTDGFDEIVGGRGKDELFGLEGNDTLNGGRGKDILDGGLGNDVLTGGRGKDIFVLAVGEGADTITDFNDGNNLIGLSNGLTFAELSFAGNSILVDDTKEILASVTGVDTATLTASDFIHF